MRIAIASTLALALAASGCKALGFHEEQKDLSSYTTKVGEAFAPNPAKPDEKTIVVKKFTLDLASNPPKVDLVLKNDGAGQDLFLAEVEFGYPVPAGSVAPYAPEFRPVFWEDYLKNEERAESVRGSTLQTEKPVFARLIITTGSNARATTACESTNLGLKRGSLFIEDKVEVVKIEGDTNADEPVLRFTLQNVDDTKKTAEIGNLRYTCQFFDRQGKLIPLGKRFYAMKPTPKPLGKFGDTVTIDVAPGKLEAGVSLVGARPVLYVAAPKK